MRRVFPTGKCWCGCGESTERTSFFVPGHDKRAEAKVVKEVYGSVVELLAAHGYGPDGRDPSTPHLRDALDVKGLQLLEDWEWNKEPPREESPRNMHVVLEFLNVEDRTRPLCRAENFHVRYLASDRVAHFERCSSTKVSGCNLTIPSGSKLTVPFVDIGWVYIERDERNFPTGVVRLRGAIVPDPIRFLPFG